MRAAGLQRAGAGLSLAAFLTEADPDVAAIGEIDAGDALATATRLDREWAYRGGQALMWKRTFAAHEVHELYLPLSPLRAFDRRGLLRVDGRHAGAELHLLATQFARDRSAVRDLRFARKAVRAVTGAVLLFVCDATPMRAGFADLGLHSIEPLADVAIWGRGYALELVSARAAERGLGSVVAARAFRV